MSFALSISSNENLQITNAIDDSESNLLIEIFLVSSTPPKKLAPLRISPFALRPMGAISRKDLCMTQFTIGLPVSHLEFSCRDWRELTRVKFRGSHPAPEQWPSSDQRLRISQVSLSFWFRSSKQCRLTADHRDFLQRAETVAGDVDVVGGNVVCGHGSRPQGWDDGGAGSGQSASGRISPLGHWQCTMRRRMPPPPHVTSHCTARTHHHRSIASPFYSILVHLTFSICITCTPSG